MLTSPHYCFINIAQEWLCGPDVNLKVHSPESRCEFPSFKSLHLLLLKHFLILHSGAATPLNMWRLPPPRQHRFVYLGL